MADFSALKTAIQNAIRTNGNNEITGQLLQDILLSMVVVLGDEAITNVADDLSTETTQRRNADGTLQGNINAEATARATADAALQNAINTINSNFSNGYVYAGIATPSATPVTGKVFYIATTAGTYTNFGGLTVTKGINILKYNGSTWSQEKIIGIDDYPTAGSSGLALSGGIDAEIKSLVGYYTCGTAAATAAKTIDASAYILLQGGSIKVKFTYKNTAADATLKIGSADAKPLFYGGRRAGSSNSWEAGEVVEIFYDGTNYMANNVMGGGAGDGAFDISVYNAVDGTPTPYNDLAAALGTNGANIPEHLRKGGMSVKFIQGTVQSSDNKYVQYRLMAQSFTTDVADWQVIDGGQELLNKVEGYEFLDFQAGYIDNGSMAIGDVVSLQRQISTQGIKSAVIACNVGDVFTMNNLSVNTTARLWAFIDSEYKLVKKAVPPFETSRYNLVAPANGYLIANDNSNSICFKGKDISFVEKEFDEKIDVIKLNQILIEQGGITTNTGDNIANAMLVRTADYFHRAYKLTVPEGYNIRFAFLYNLSTLAFVRFESVMDSTYECSGEYAVRVTIQKGNSSTLDTNITPSDIKDVLSLEYLNEKLKPVEDFSVKETENISILDERTRIAITNPGEYYETAGHNGKIDGPHTSASGISCSVISCQEGDEFTVNASTGMAHIGNWVFVDDNDNIIEKASTADPVINEPLIAPYGATKLIIQDKEGGISFKGHAFQTVDKKINDSLLVTGKNTLVFEQGGINTSNGQETDSSDALYYKRIRTKGFYAYVGSVFTPKDNHVMMIAMYRDADCSNYIGMCYTGGLHYSSNIPFVLKTSCYCRIIMGSRGGGASNITPIEGRPNMECKILGFNMVYNAKKTNMLNTMMIPCYELLTDTVVNSVPYDRNDNPYTLDEIYNGYDALLTNFGSYVNKVNLGKDSSGLYDIYRYEFTPESPRILAYDGIYPNGNKYDNKTYPLIVLDSGLHGIEKPSTRALLNLMTLICNSKADEGVLGWLRRNVRFWVIPVVCPWGYVNGTRYNYNHVNINRNFDTPNWVNGTSDPTSDDYRGTTPASEKETQYVQNMLKEALDSGCATFYYNYHTHGEFSSWAGMTSFSFSGDNENDDLQKIGIELAKAITVSGWNNHNLPTNSDYIGQAEAIIQFALASDYAFQLGILGATPECMWRYYDGQTVADYSTDINCMNVEYLLKSIVIAIKRLLYI